MSRSKRKPIIKDRPRNNKKSTLYWRIVRRVTKQYVKLGKEIPNEKTIVNDYDYCDYTMDLTKDKDSKKYSRK